MLTEIVGLKNESGLFKHQINLQYLQILFDLNRLKFEILEELSQKQPEEQPSVVDTAYQTLATLSLNSGIPEVVKVFEFIFKNDRHSISILPNSFFIHQRFLAMERFIRETKPKQIIDVACGLMPHDIRVLQMFPETNYICVDFPEIIAAKQNINEALWGEQSNINYISGDLFELDLWAALNMLIDPTKKTLIFCEGFVMYPDRDQWLKFTQNLRDLMVQIPDSVFLHEDTLKAHLELMQDRNFTKLYSHLTSISGLKNLATNFQTKADFEKTRWLETGFKVVERYSQQLPTEAINLENIFEPGAKEVCDSTNSFKLWEIGII